MFRFCGNYVDKQSDYSSLWSCEQNLRLPSWICTSEPVYSVPGICTWAQNQNPEFTTRHCLRDRADKRIYMRKRTYNNAKKMF